MTPDAPASVHYAAYPKADESLIDEALSAHMTLVRRLVDLGRAARADAAVKTRQPLSRALVSSAGFDSLPADLLAQLAAELNVGSIESIAQAGGALADTSAKPNFRTLGKRFGKQVQEVAAAITAADAGSLKDSLGNSGSASVWVSGTEVTLGPDDVIITEKPREGWAVGHDAGATVALDLRITPDLHRTGLARDAIRQIQEARKASGLDITDRIALRYEASDPDLLEAMTEHGKLIAEEVLATDYAAGGPVLADTVLAGSAEFSDESLGLRFWLAKLA